MEKPFLWPVNVKKENNRKENKRLLRYKNNFPVKLELEKDLSIKMKVISTKTASAKNCKNFYLKKTKSSLQKNFFREIFSGTCQQPRLNFSAQNDVRMGLQWEDLLGKCSSKLLVFFGLHGASNGVKWCKSEGVKDKLTPTLTSFWSVKGGKTM